MVPLTEDQTLVRELLNRGTLTLEQARVHPHRSVITQALGGPEPIRVALVHATLRRGDRLLLCTDGLYGDLPEDRMQQLLAQGLGPQPTLERMVEEALQRGGHDNITALLLDLDDPAFPLPLDDEPVRVVEPVLPPAPREAPALLSRLGRILGRK
jgi:protein phosphatase